MRLPLHQIGRPGRYGRLTGGTYLYNPLTVMKWRVTAKMNAKAARMSVVVFMALTPFRNDVVSLSIP